MDPQGVSDGVQNRVQVWYHAASLARYSSRVVGPKVPILTTFGPLLVTFCSLLVSSYLVSRPTNRPNTGFGTPEMTHFRGILDPKYLILGV